MMVRKEDKEKAQKFMTKKCSNCGALNKPTDNKCKNCGKEL